MSKFLAPIHYWVYNKVALQEQLIAAIAQAARDNEWDSEIDYDSYVVADMPALERVIDQANIHGWLQARIGQAESRYAQLVTALLKSNASRLATLQNVAYAFGTHYAVAGSTPMEAYQGFETNLLNGMPCDRVNVVTDQTETRVSWEEQQDLHSVFWEEAGGDPAHYRALRAAVMRGMLDASDIELRVAGDHAFELAVA